MRRIRLAAMLSVLVLGAWAPAIHAQTPTLYTPGATCILLCPRLPVNPVLPVYPSVPYVGPLGVCPGDIVTALALYFCSGLSGGPATGGEPAPLVIRTVGGPTPGGGGGSGGGGGGGSCSAGSICVSAASSLCWNGTDGGVVGGQPTSGPTGGFISGCGSAGDFFGVLQPGDQLGAAISITTNGGTVTLTANCGSGHMDTETNTSSSGVTAACGLPF